MSLWKKLHSRIAYENPWIVLHEDRAINPAGNEVIYGYIESKSHGVYVVPLDKDNNTYIIRQFRYPIGRESWECVAGRTDGEPVEQATRRELLEEAGLKAQEIITLSDMDSLPSVSSLRVTLCIATDVTKISDQLDKTDGILEMKKVSLPEVRNMILAGEIQSAESIAAFLTTIAYLEAQTDTVQ